MKICPAACLAILCLWTAWGVTAAQTPRPVMTLESAPSGVGAVPKITSHKRYFILEVESVQPPDIDQLTFVDIPLTSTGADDQPFAACALALNLQTNVAGIPQPMRYLWAAAYRRFGQLGAKVALIGCPYHELRRVMQEVVSAADELPHLPGGGQTITIPVTIVTGQYLKFFGPDDCKLYGPRDELLREVTPTGDVPALRSGPNAVPFHCEPAGDVRPRASVTVISQAAPYGGTNSPSQIRQDVLHSAGWADQDLAAVTPVMNFDPGPEYADAKRRFQGIPTLEGSPGGRLWAAWYGGGVTEDRHNYVMLVTSRDDGRTWSGLKLVIDPDRDGPVRAFDPCLWCDPLGRLWLFWAQRANKGQAHLFATVTENPDEERPLWTRPRRIGPGIMMCKPTVLRNGTWLLPTAIWFTEQSCRVLASTDHGRTWSLLGTASVPNPKDRNCDEPMIVEHRDGRLSMWVRTRYGIGQSISRDGGRTWSPVAPSKIAHPPARFFVRRLTSDHLLLVKHGPIQRRTGRSHLTAFVSEDDGRTWRGGLLLDERPGVSYPDGFQKKDGRIFIIHDYDRQGAKEILLSVFTEADVRAGRNVSGQVRLRQLVNRATGKNPMKKKP